MIRPALIDLNPLELNYYPFIINLINLDKFSGNYNSVDVLSTKICVATKTKYINVRVVNMTTNKNEARTMVQQVSCDCKCKFNSTTWSSNQKMEYW